MSTSSPRDERGGLDRIDAERGFTLVELCASALLSALLLLTLQSTLQSSIRTRTQARTLEVRHAQADEYLQRLTTIPFGTGAEDAPTPAQLTEFFDDDGELGGLTLRQLQTPAGSAGHGFTTESDGVTTLWRVSINDDLDGDGAATGAREGRPDLLRIEIFAEDRLMFRTMRAADVPNTRRD